MKTVMGLSGGMDSATLLGLLLEQGVEVHCCTFYYGSKQNKWENRAAKNIIDFYQFKKFPVFGHPIDLRTIFMDFSSDLLLTGGEIPEGHYEEKSMKRTVVPGRNTIFASIMMGLAESIGAEEIALGVHSGDHHIYPDCREEYIQSLSHTVHLATEGNVIVSTPLIENNKTSILELGFRMEPKVPYGMTRTCYTDHPFACGKCGSCVERLEAFANLKIKDPIQYQ